MYAADGTLLQEYFNQNRTLTPFAEIPPHMVKMLIAVEDQEFYDHWGINPRRILVVAFENLLKMKIEAGASTITQQLARMLFLNREQTYTRKIKEALTAIKLERTYSKNEILETYLNLYYFHRAYGIAAAASVFFNKKPSELTINDCAILLGMLKGPTINSPFNNPDKSLQARNRVLYAYYKYGGISKDQYESLKDQPLDVNPQPEEVSGAPYFTEYIRQYIENTYGTDKLYNGGLKVYTTLDLPLQQSAEEAMTRHLDSLQRMVEARHDSYDPNYTFVVMKDGVRTHIYKRIEGAAISIDNKTGDILAMVGGHDFDKTQFNRATQALRQPGSTFKPFVYTAAIDNGWTPDSILFDNSIVLNIPGSPDWRPRNFDGEYMGRMTIREGLKLSRNMIAIKLLLKIRPELVVFYAQQMGITSPLRPVPSLAIGTSEVHLDEITSAYTVFPNGGIRIQPRAILKIVDRYGNILEDNSAIKKEEVLNEQTAYIMVNMLQSVLEPGGTGAGTRYRGFARPAGGKTGTSDNFCDTWFIGFTPQITTGVWMGFDDKTSIGHNMTGAVNALPVWTQIMLTAHRDLPQEDFPIPPGIVMADVCEESGKLATVHCPTIMREIFTEATVPTDSCAVHTRGGPYTSDRYRNVLPDTTSGSIRF
ncbi:MAG: PBP1A family penicillin-binding protein [candidate division Zixibacteria bacterium]|nr:PBP1A family penicillin-binding protein [candidate division Zixibacteria bacterium]